MAKSPINTNKLKKSVRLFLESIGEDVDREGLKETPDRVARMWEEFFQYRDFACKDFAEDGLGENNNGYVLVRDIPLYSYCEHHLVPFFGKCNVAYVPDGKVIGISKLARIVYKHSYRPQIQERLTKSILDEIRELTNSNDIIVHIDAQHLCMVMRGAKAASSSTVTVEATGRFNDPTSFFRSEFIGLISKT